MSKLSNLIQDKYYFNQFYYGHNNCFNLFLSAIFFTIILFLEFIMNSQTQSYTQVLHIKMLSKGKNKHPSWNVCIIFSSMPVYRKPQFVNNKTLINWIVILHEIQFAYHGIYLCFSFHLVFITFLIPSCIYWYFYAIWYLLIFLIPSGILLYFSYHLVFTYIFHTIWYLSHFSYHLVFTYISHTIWYLLHFSYHLVFTYISHTIWYLLTFLIPSGIYYISHTIGYLLTFLIATIWYLFASDICLQEPILRYISKIDRKNNYSIL